MPSRWLPLNEAFDAAQKSPEGCREEKFQAFLRQGEIKAKAEVLRVSLQVIQRQSMKTRVDVEYRASPDVEYRAKLTPDFWRLAEVDFSTSTATRKTYGGTKVSTAEGVLVRRIDHERLWPPVQKSEEQVITNKNQGGRKQKWNWEGAIVEMGRIVHDEGFPKTQSEMVDRLQQWFRNTQKGEPAESGTKDRVSRFYKAFPSQGR